MKFIKTLSNAAVQVTEGMAEVAVTSCSALNHVAKAADYYAEEIEADAKHSCDISRSEREAELQALEAELA